MGTAGLKQSASKEDFMKALNLNMLNPADNAALKEMWEEVTNYWNRNFETSTDRGILKPEYAVNDKVQRPYKWAHLEPTAIDAAIAAIWQTAKTGPRRYYDLGRSEDKRVYNWVLKWLLWHVCRYRDWRNRKSRTPSSSARPATAVAASTPPVVGRKRSASAARLLDNGHELKRLCPGDDEREKTGS